MTQTTKWCFHCGKLATQTKWETQTFVFEDATKRRGVRFEYEMQIEGCWYCDYEVQQCNLPALTTLIVNAS